MPLQLILCTAMKQIFIISGPKLLLQGRRMPRVVEKHVALLQGRRSTSHSAAVNITLLHIAEAVLHSNPIQLSPMAKNISNLFQKCLRGAVNQDCYLKTFLENIKALVFFSLPPKLTQGFCLYRNKQTIELFLPPS